MLEIAKIGIAILGWVIAIILGVRVYIQVKHIENLKEQVNLIEQREIILSKMLENNREATEYIAEIISDEKMKQDTAKKINEIFNRQR